jgi:translation initiation factor 5
LKQFQTMADTVLLPILKDTRDPHYRYKMPKLTAKVEGSGNGIKTVLTNIVSVAKSLGRPPSYPTKYFGCELGAQVTMHDDLFIVNGAHDPDKLLNLLYVFIKRFVLCPKCSNPETDLSVVGGVIKQKCIACGNGNVINKGVHKLTTYIVSHPPGSTNEVAAAAAGSGSAVKAKEKGGKGEKKANGKKVNAIFLFFFIFK